MGFMIPCPHCGPRNVYEFAFGGETKQAPGPDADLTVWREYLYCNENKSGVQDEWWFHSMGCGRWFKLTRDTATNQVIGD